MTFPRYALINSVGGFPIIGADTLEEIRREAKEERAFGVRCYIVTLNTATGEKIRKLKT